MKRRTFISLMSVLAAAGVLTLSGCSSNASSSNSNSSSRSESAEAADQLASIQASGKLIVALEGAWQPWSYHDESDTLVGYDVEVSRAIAEKLGVEPEYVESDWDSLFAGLDAGRYDMVCNGVEVTDERALTYDFTTPYGYIHTALAVKKDNDTIQTFEDLKGKTTANSLASTYMVAGVVLSAIGWYAPLAEFAGCGATVPLLGFGHLLAKGVRTALEEEGAVGILTGGLTAAAAGITTSLVCGVVCSWVGKSHDQN